MKQYRWWQWPDAVSGLSVLQRLVPAALALAGLMALAGCQTSYSTSTSQLPAGVSSSPSSPVSADVRKAAMTRLELAGNYLGIGRLDVAMEEVNNALALDPGLVDAYMVRGMVFAQRSDFASAEADYARVLRTRPNDPDVLHNYGWLQCQQNKYEAGNQYFERVLATPGYANSARTLMAKGLCLQAAGRNPEAIAALERAYRTEPGNPIVAYNLAYLLYHAGRVADAQVYLRRLNASELANAETLWLGIKAENALGNQLGVRELGSVLGHKFPQSKEYSLYERGAFYE
ncbi:type IV pilus biogenesis/stability protein PilW [Corticibacter populi]|uniref:Type IV pilus biogenesis/stability protein PilW n=1 Tax=Corticibacter populi TaxID=1550736 RepID=A0A3M6QXU8_9BURK|nr:type IV pilus biogenesis/stability protein PilW [Corticibacter populi]RMX07814.1 type IV pilus biogenesis/stability protein PilW [Corticibacter populi]RZS35045.1 type IV pilus assembly protein PilF [Corticibacter populi]